MPQRKAIFFQWEKEIDLGKGMATPKIFGGPGKLLIEPVIGDYFDIIMEDPKPPSNPTPMKAEKAFGLGSKTKGYTRDTNYLEDPKGTQNTPATVGEKIHLRGGRHSGDRKKGKRVLIPTQESYQVEKMKNGVQEKILRYKVKSFTFPDFFNITMIRQLLGQMLKKNYPQTIKIEGTVYDFVQFPLEQKRFKPEGFSEATSGAWLVKDEKEMLTKPTTVAEEYWNRIYQSVADGVPI